ncbi:ankyrin repeat domain-containing protein [Candidatus Phycorickettsia trachydisci]|nr:ankyrin repeat domain-containing protein [Candidatus Phycorickettsia trachydisci]
MKIEDMERYFTTLGPDQDLLRLASYDKPELIKELVENRSADVNAKSKPSETTPLHETIIGEEEFGKTSVEIMKYLISKGADINALNSKGQTPLDLAAEKFGFLCMGELLLHKAEPNTRDIALLKTIASQNYGGGKNVIAQIQNIDTLRNKVLELEENDKKYDLLDKLASQETRLTQKLPEYLSKKIQEGYENKQQNLQYLSHVSEMLAKGIESLKNLPSEEIDKASPEEKQDFEERLDLMQKYLEAYSESIRILKAEKITTEAINDLTDVTGDLSHEGVEKLTIGGTDTEEA